MGYREMAYRVLHTFGPELLEAWNSKSNPKPRNPRQFDGIAGGRKRVSDTLLTKTVFDTLRGAQPLSHALFGVKTLSGTLLGPAFDEPWVAGLGTRTCGASCRAPPSPATHAIWTR